MVVLTGPADGGQAGEAGPRGADYVRHLVRIVRALPEAPGEPPRLYVVARNAQRVVPKTCPTWSRRGCGAWCG